MTADIDDDAHAKALRILRRGDPGFDALDAETREMLIAASNVEICARVVDIERAPPSIKMLALAATA